MPEIYICDDSFEGFLSGIYDFFYSKVKPSDIVLKKEYVPDLLNNPLEIKTDTEKSNKVYEAILNKIGNETLENIYYLFLSNYQNKGSLAYEYLKLGFKKGKAINNMLSNDTVLMVSKIAKKLTVERHAMLGLVRFKHLGNNLYYSAIEPDHNILPIIAPHFATRFADQNFIIHDLKREEAIIYDLEDWVITPLENKKEIKTYPEDDFDFLWKTYFNSISIENRKNTKRQNSQIKKSYRKHLNEFN